MALEVKRLRARRRANSEPVKSLGLIGNRKRTRSASIESSMYDEDYKAYSRAHFDAEQRMQRPWTLGPPDQIFDHTKLTGMFDLALLWLYALQMLCRESSS